MKRLAESNEDKGIKITDCGTRVAAEAMGGGKRTLSKRRRFARGRIINLISFGERAGLIVRSDGSTWMLVVRETQGGGCFCFNSHYVRSAFILKSIWRRNLKGNWWCDSILSLDPSLRECRYIFFYTENNFLYSIQI